MPTIIDKTMLNEGNLNMLNILVWLALEIAELEESETWRFASAGLIINKYVNNKIIIIKFIR